MKEYVNSVGDHVTAMHLTTELADIAAAWCRGLVVEEIDPFDSTKRQPGINVGTPEGVKRASLDDYILQKPNGSFDVMKPNEFSNTHKPWEM